MSTILLDIIETCLLVGATPTVAAILKLDQRVRDYIAPVSLPLSPGEDHTQPVEATIFQRNVMFCVRETSKYPFQTRLFFYTNSIFQRLCSSIGEPVFLFAKDHHSYLHRTLFIYALHEDVKDPLCSKFAGSVLSVYVVCGLTKLLNTYHRSQSC